MGIGIKEDVLGTFGLLDFTMLWPVLTWRFLKLTKHVFNFPIFFGPQETADTGA
jgi:hypothetical protein